VKRVCRRLSHGFYCVLDEIRCSFVSEVPFEVPMIPNFLNRHGSGNCPEKGLIPLLSADSRFFLPEDLMPMFACNLLRIKVIFCYA
jgi:hypothetical protein